MSLDLPRRMDESAFTGCLVPCRLIGVIEAEQTQEKETVRNDRLIAVASVSHAHGEVKSLDQISERLIDEIEHFFLSYNEVKGKVFKPIGRHGPDRARALVEEAMERYRKDNSSRSRVETQTVRR